MEFETQPKLEQRRAGEQFVVRMPEGLRAKLKELSTANRRSMNAQLVMLLEDGIKQHARAAEQ